MKTLILSMTLTMLAVCATGRPVGLDLIPAAALTVPKTFLSKSGKTIPYRWAEPAVVESGRRYPLVVLFHGAGERGTNNVAQLIHGATDILNYMRENDIEAYFIAGQCPDGKRWVEKDWGLREHTMDQEPSEPLALVMELIDKTVREKAVDPDRILVTGISMGGYATWEAVQRRPDLFAAAMPCCGGGDTAMAKAIAKVPIWTFHGSADGVVPVWRSRSMVSALWTIDGDIRYREYPGCGHNCWAATYADWDNVLKWFFSRTRSR